MTASPEVVVWNTKVGSRAGFTKELDALPKAPVIGLMETGGHREQILMWARAHRYRIVSGSGDIGASSQLLINERQAPVIHSGVLNVRTKWRGPKGKRIAGRSFPWASVNLDGEPLVVLLVHMPWNPRRNWRAWVASLRTIRRFVNARRGVDVLIVGDLNVPATKGGLGSMRALARQVGGRIVTTGASVDYGIYRPAPRAHGVRRPLITRGRRLDRLGSDHPVVTYEIGAA